MQERLDAVLAALAGGPSTAYDLLPAVYGDKLTPAITGWMLTKVSAT